MSARLAIAAIAAVGLAFGCGGGGSSEPPLAPPSGLHYGVNPALYTRDVAVTPNTPGSGGGGIAAYAISPALPAGLTLNPSTGSISGMPTVVTRIATYTVTASNAAGSTTCPLDMGVLAPLPTIGLAASYRLDGSAVDESGNANHGTVSGPTATSDRFGKAGCAYLFASATDEIVVPSSASLNLTALTLSAWVKPAALACFQTLLSKGGNGSGYTPQYELYSCGAVRFLSSDAYQGTYQFSAAHGLANGTWQHVVVTQAGTTRAFYIDGRLDASTTTADALAAPTTQSLRLGNEARHWTTTFYAGALDDVRIYGRELTADEVAALYHEGGWDFR
jgi:hypothetical protein